MSRQSIPKRSLKQLSTVVVTVVLITSLFAGGALAQMGDEADPADEVFVDENGDAVLLYEENATDEASGELGLDVSESVVYAMISDEMEEDVSGAFSMELTDDSLSSASEFAADRPDEVDDLSMNVTSEQTQENSEFDAALDLTTESMIGTGDADERTGSFSGESSSSADEYATEGEFSVSPGVGASQAETSFDLEISESDGGYTLDVGQQQSIAQYQAGNWETEAAAKQTLKSQFAAVEDELDGTVTVDVHDYEFVENEMGGGQLDIEYTVELENVTDGLESTLADDFADDPAFDMDRDEAEELAADVLAFELETIDLSYAMTPDAVEGSWNIAFSDFDSTANAVFDFAESTGETGETFDDYAERYDAQAQANLTQTSEWELTFTDDGTESTISGEMATDTENWEAYVQELEDRDIETPEFSMTASAETVDDEIDMEMNFEVGQEEMIQTAVSTMIENLQQSSTTDDEAIEFMTAFEEADLQIAKFDLNMDDGTVEVETGAKFDDFTAFEDHLEDAFSGLSISHVYADEDAGYVYVTELVDGEATEDDVLSHEAVGDETDIHMPGEWDEDHPRLDTDEVNEYLSTENSSDEDTEEDEDTDSTPGFGVTVALVAVLSTLVLFRRD
ncbi:PGF-CTERM sorting domain-containing protein [Halostagnicola sp. A56]|uniref:PGF-CTERM sorting domain-containing protein n=1 Tax=Halostagnicola sp. A56 TaxID=1495067 RepID=UPI001E5E2DE1|nr:PGF-CTERM sorting domain-containing protein [Halostagnicola sp. A56]